MLESYTERQSDILILDREDLDGINFKDNDMQSAEYGLAMI